MVLCDKLRIRIAAAIIAFLVAFCILPAAAPGQTGSEAFAGSRDSIGSLKWSTAVPYTNLMESASAPAVWNKYLFVASGKNLYKYAATNGSLVASAEIGVGVGRNKLAPTVAGDKILMALKGAPASKSSEGTAPALAVVDADTMAVNIVEYVPAEGEASQIGYQSLTPVAYDGNGYAYFGSFDVKAGGTYFKVDLSRAGEEGYSAEVIATSEEGFYWAGACCNGSTVVFGSNSNGTNDSYTPSDGSAILYAYDSANGECKELILENSGSICSIVQYYNGYYYIVGKNGYLFKVKVGETMSLAGKLSLGGYSTCTPEILRGRAYIGCAKTDYSAGLVAIVDLGSFSILKTYAAPADVKALKVFRSDAGDIRVYTTYNSAPGGLYEVTAKYNYFIPPKEKQQYCISTIATVSGTDSILYYINDSCNLMAVKKIAASFEKPSKMAAPTVAKSTNTSVKVSWSKRTGITGYQVAYSSYPDKNFYVKKIGKSYLATKIAATKGKTRYYKVRAYKVIGSYTIYGTWSSVRKYTLK